MRSPMPTRIEFLTFAWKKLLDNLSLLSFQLLKTVSACSLLAVDAAGVHFRLAPSGTIRAWQFDAASSKFMLRMTYSGHVRGVTSSIVAGGT